MPTTRSPHFVGGSPRTWRTEIGWHAKTLDNFGARNDHYIFDNASFEFPLGLMMLAAVRWPSWRVPALAFATLHWGLHALSDIVDPHHAAGESIGWLEAAGLVVTTALLGIALRASVVEEKG